MAISLLKTGTFAGKLAAIGLCGAVAFSGGIKTADAQFGAGTTAITTELKLILAELKVQTTLHQTRNASLLEAVVLLQSITAAIGPIDVPVSPSFASIEGLSLVQEVVPDVSSLIDGDKETKLPLAGSYGDFLRKAPELLGNIVSYKKLLEDIKNGDASVNVSLPSWEVLNQRRRSFFADSINRQMSMSLSALSDAGKAENNAQSLQFQKNAAGTLQAKTAANGDLLVANLKAVNKVLLAIAHMNYAESTKNLTEIPHLTTELGGQDVPPPNDNNVGALKR